MTVNISDELYLSVCRAKLQIKFYYSILADVKSNYQFCLSFGLNCETSLELFSPLRWVIIKFSNDILISIRITRTFHRGGIRVIWVVFVETITNYESLIISPECQELVDFFDNS